MVETVINLQSANIVIVSEVIDVLVLLTAFTPENREFIFKNQNR